MDLAKLRSEFTNRFGTVPRVFRAPGRVNLIGEHTDYNDGFVFPCAIDFAAYVACSLRDDRRINVASLTLDTGFSFGLDDAEGAGFPQWVRYVQGMAILLERTGRKLTGADVLIDSSVPIGAGLSSSAALEVAVGLALAESALHKINGMELARLGQAAEHEFAGVRSGIMDQFASVFGRSGHALFLDCRSMDWEPVGLDGASFVICNTKTKHDLADGEYNNRRAECEEAAAALGVRSLRDVTPERLEAGIHLLREPAARRARHVVSENSRVLDAKRALEASDLAEFGRLMNGSHQSLRDDFEVSCRELDIMVKLAQEQPGTLGARMTGGGFGGCTVNLVDPAEQRRFIEVVSEGYLAATGIEPEMYECRAAEGAGEVIADARP
jgi:galactokinase